MNINDLKIAIVGATGVVGSTAIQILEERLHPKENIFPLASKRSNGKKIKYLGDNLTVKEINKDSFNDLNIAIFAAGGTVSEQFVDIAIKKGVFQSIYQLLCEGYNPQTMHLPYYSLFLFSLQLDLEIYISILGNCQFLHQLQIASYHEEHKLKIHFLLHWIVY